MRRLLWQSLPVVFLSVQLRSGARTQLHPAQWSRIGNGQLGAASSEVLRYLQSLYRQFWVLQLCIFCLVSEKPIREQHPSPFSPCSCALYFARSSKNACLTGSPPSGVCLGCISLPSSAAQLQDWAGKRLVGQARPGIANFSEQVANEELNTEMIQKLILHNVYYMFIIVPFYCLLAYCIMNGQFGDKSNFILAVIIWENWTSGLSPSSDIENKQGSSLVTMQ